MIYEARRRSGEMIASERHGIGSLIRFWVGDGGCFIGWCLALFTGRRGV